VADGIIIPFSSDGSEMIEDGTEIDLLASYTDGWITIQLNLMELDENEQEVLDPALLTALLRTNYALNICKFGFSPYGLSLLIDYDTRNLQYEEIESGIGSLLYGLDVYVTIVAEWLNYVLQIAELEFQELNEAECRKLQETNLAEVKNEENQEAGLKTQAIRALTGIMKAGGTAAVFTGLGTLIGLPVDLMGPIFTACAGICRTD
jgi:hypothetical protein